MFLERGRYRFMGLNNMNLNPIGKVILSDLIELKSQYEYYLKKKVLWMYIMIVCLGGFIGYTTLFTLIPYWNNLGMIIRRFLAGSDHLFLLLLSIVSYATFQKIHQTCEKKEEEFHSLRCEVIQRSEELWGQNHLDIKYQIFEEMKKSYGINLYYEN